MTKLKLRPDDLRVDSFVPAGSGAGRGTVVGNRHDPDPTSPVICDYGDTQVCHTNKCAGFYPSGSCDTANYTCDQAESCACLYDNTHPLICCSDVGCTNGGMC